MSKHSLLTKWGVHAWDWETHCLTLEHVLFGRFKQARGGLKVRFRCRFVPLFPFAPCVCCKCYALRMREIVVLLYCLLNCNSFPIVHSQIINNNTLYSSLCVSRLAFVPVCAGRLYKFLHQSSIFFTIHSTPNFNKTLIKQINNIKNSLFRNQASSGTKQLSITRCLQSCPLSPSRLSHSSPPQAALT